MLLRQTDGFDGAADAAYEMLLRAHRDRGDAESNELNARLVLILANEVGCKRLAAAIDLAKRSFGEASFETPT